MHLTIRYILIAMENVTTDGTLYAIKSIVNFIVFNIRERKT